MGEGGGEGHILVACRHGNVFHEVIGYHIDWRVSIPVRYKATYVKAICVINRALSLFLVELSKNELTLGRDYLTLCEKFN